MADPIDSQCPSEEESFNLDDCSSLSAEDDDFSPKKNYYKRKNRSIRRRSRKASKRNPFNSSTWSLQENMIYREFLLLKSQLFDSDSLQRKAIKINVQMSQFVKTRSPEQCRSHHQKMTKHYRFISDIISHIEGLMETAGILQQTKIEEQRRLPLPEVPLKDWNEFEADRRSEQSLWEKLMKDLSSAGSSMQHSGQNQLP